jgi:hypothetical protein
MADISRAAFIDDALASRVDGCILWPFAVRKSSGYPAHSVRVSGVKRNVDAHRYVCRLAHGEPPMPKGEAAHTCGNKLCVNPQHLYWADHVTNMADAKRHGVLRGGGRYRQRIFASDIASICRSPSSAITVASVYGVTPTYISALRRRYPVATDVRT